jgi:hypothetical protein
MAARLLNDSMHFTPQGRRLLASIGAIDRDPLRVEAERWLSEHRGPMTEAVLAVRHALAPKPPADWLEAARAFRNVK